LKKCMLETQNGKIQNILSLKQRIYCWSGFKLIIMASYLMDG
jgi:hypothetical protein